MSGGGYRGGGRGRGRGGRNNNYNSGRGYHSSRGGGGRGGGHPQARLRPCGPFTTTGSCNNTNCKFAHVVKLHASIEATNRISNPNKSNNNNNYNQDRGYNNTQYATVSSVAIWETQGNIKIFTGSTDGYWRLWNTASMNKEFEHQVGTVQCVTVASNFLFCGFENATLQLPETKVGMIHAWNLATPTNPPLEFQVQSPLIPYAHNASTSCIIVQEGGDTIVSGAKDGSIRVWSFDATSNTFLLKQTIVGHAGQVTGLQLVDNFLWSSSIDHSIRLWDLNKNGECQYLINKEHNGHANAVTSLLKFTSAAGVFVLSSSLDGTIKAFNGKNGECVASETHGDGVVCMALATDLQSNPILLIGLESGNIMCRNVVQTAKTPAFCLLFTLSSKYSAGHTGAVKCLAPGPSSTFYSGGDDGKLMVWQIAGDLGI